MSSECNRPVAHYRMRYSEVRSRLTTTAKRTTYWLLTALALLGVELAALVEAGRGRWTPWLALGGLVAIVAASFRYIRARDERVKAERLQSYLARALERVDGNSMHSGDGGEEFREHGHIYDRDLNILGPGSVFDLLATVGTDVGRRALAGALLHLPPREQTCQRQEAIRELAGRTRVREQIAMIAGAEGGRGRAEAFECWIKAPEAWLPTWLRSGLVGGSAVLVLLCVAAAWGRMSFLGWFENVAAVLAFQGAIALRYHRIVAPLIDSSSGLEDQCRRVRQGLGLLRETGGECELLRTLREKTEVPFDAASALLALERHLILLHQRKTEWFYLPSLAFSIGTQAAISIQAWKRAYGSLLLQWVKVWGEFEVLHAFAGYAYEHPQNVYPEMLPEEATATYELQGLRHPLLPDCIANDVSLNSETRFYLISGSNMSGKSTLLRSMGISIVLARAGAPIPARSARMTPLELGTSVALEDSLADGRSRFLAEVERLHAILLLGRKGQLIFLIDEVFSGTNSEDRRMAANAIVEALLDRGAIGALSTHDLALAALATRERGGINVHMSSKEGNPLAFDYLLKPGANTSSNALAILRLVGLPGVVE